MRFDYGKLIGRKAIVYQKTDAAQDLTRRRPPLRRESPASAVPLRSSPDRDVVYQPEPTSDQGACMSQAIVSDAAPKQAGPYSHAVRTGNLLFCSGQGPYEPGTGRIPESFEDQVRQTLRNLAAVAEAAGGSLDRAVRVGVYLRDMQSFAALNAVYAEFFHEPYPARTTVQSSMRIDVEIDAVIELDD
jgi:2-iminobutanoate/2-iminopropanoate deaminase